MAQQFDVTFKTLLLRSTGVISKILFGGKVVEWLNVEQPDVRNPRGDTVARCTDGVARHVELQSKNDPEMSFRILDYYVGFRRTMREEVEQWVVYGGREPLRMDPFFLSPSTLHYYKIMNLREMDGAPLLESDDWVDNEFALLAKADPEEVIRVVEARLRQLQGQEQAEAVCSFVLLSGILGMEEEIGRRLKTSMFDVMENKVLGPAIRQGIEQGIKQGMERGMQQGMQQGMAEILKGLLAQHFGPCLRRPQTKSRMQTTRS